MVTTTRGRAGMPEAHKGRVAARGSWPELSARVDEICNRHPAVGLAVGIVRDGKLGFFGGRGLADIASDTPVSEETVFRIGSLTKTFTAIAVLQLYEQGLVDLDAPANDYLRAYRLVAARADLRPPTLRHLLTHTAGIPEVVHLADLFHPSWGPFEARPAIPSVETGHPLPPLGDYYRDGLRFVSEPGTAFTYSNHGFATLGQIVEDVSGMSLARYFRERIFEPLGLADTTLVRSELDRTRLATGYVLGSKGARPVPDRDWLGAGGGGIYSTTHDMARFIATLLGGGASEHGAVLQPATFATMIEPHYRPDPRIPGVGLGLFRYDTGGHRIAGHEGRLPGFTAQFLVAPDDGIGAFAVTNGSSGAFVWLPMELGRLLRALLGVADDAVRGDVPQHPEIWGHLCGRYQLPRVADLRGRLMMGGGVEVFVGGGRLMARVLTPIPALYRGLPLQPDDEGDPYMFRLDLAAFGMPAIRVAFNHEPDTGATALHTDLGSEPFSLYRRPSGDGPSVRQAGALGALALAAVATGVRRRRRERGKEAQT